MIILIFSLLTFNIQSTFASEEEDLELKVLSEINISKENLKYSDSAINRLPGHIQATLFDDKLKDPINTPTFLKSNASYLLANANSLRNLIYYSSLRLDTAIPHFLNMTLIIHIKSLKIILFFMLYQRFIHSRAKLCQIGALNI